MYVCVCVYESDSLLIISTLVSISDPPGIRILQPQIHAGVTLKPCAPFFASSSSAKKVEVPEFHRTGCPSRSGSCLWVWSLWGFLFFHTVGRGVFTLQRKRFTAFTLILAKQGNRWRAAWWRLVRVTYCISVSFSIKVCFKL